MPAKLPVFTKVIEEDVQDAPKGKWMDAIRTPLNDLLSACKSLFGKGITFNQNIDCEVSEINIQVPDPWIYPTLINGFQRDAPDGCPCRYMKHPDGSVEFQGELIDGVAGTIIAAGEINAAYLPNYRLNFAQDAAGVHNTVTIDTDGSLTCTSGTSTNTNFRYMAADATPYSSSAFPIFVSTKYSKKPLSVSIVSIEDFEDTNPKKLGSTMILDWDYITVQGEPNVRIKNICGLPYNRKYKIKLLIVGE